MIPLTERCHRPRAGARSAASCIPVLNDKKPQAPERDLRPCGMLCYGIGSQHCERRSHTTVSEPDLRFVRLRVGGLLHRRVTARRRAGGLLRFRRRCYRLVRRWCDLGLHRLCGRCDLRVGCGVLGVHGVAGSWVRSYQLKLSAACAFLRAPPPPSCR